MCKARIESLYKIYCEQRIVKTGTGEDWINLKQTKMNYEKLTSRDMLMLHVKALNAMLSDPYLKVSGFRRFYLTENLCDTKASVGKKILDDEIKHRDVSVSIRIIYEQNERMYPENALDSETTNLYIRETKFGYVEGNIEARDERLRHFYNQVYIEFTKTCILQKTVIGQLHDVFGNLIDVYSIQDLITKGLPKN